MADTDQHDDIHYVDRKRKPEPPDSSDKTYEPSTKKTLEDVSTDAPNTITTSVAELSAEQKSVLDLILSGKSVFFTGCAGTGKSFLLRSIIGALKEAGKNIAVTAMTGLAAVNIGGVTLHSWAGIKLGENAAQMKEAWTKPHNWRETDVLLVDEVSMLSAALFHRLEILAREIRANEDQPFGGIQLILSGDFFQLPPIFKTAQQKQHQTKPPVDPRSATCVKCASTPKPSTLGEELKFGLRYRREQAIAQSEKILTSLTDRRCVSDASTLEFQEIEKRYEDKLCFEAEKFDECVPNIIELTRVFRQRDAKFIAALGEVRLGCPSKKTIDLFRSRILPVDQPPPCPTEFGLPNTKPLMLFPRNVEVDQINDLELSKLEGFPTIYKGVKFSKPPNNTGLLNMLSHFLATEEINLKKDAQVILLRNMNGYLVNGRQGVIADILPFTSIEVTTAINSLPTSFMKNFRSWCSRNGPIGIPYVLFEGMLRPTVVLPVDFSIEINEETYAVLTQIPLKLAWALSIHKSQGMTLTRAEISVDNVFTTGQAYVALSRVTSLDGLIIRGKINVRDLSRVDARVIKFYEKLKAKMKWCC